MNAEASRSIVREYFQWLQKHPDATRPMAVICDFFQDVHVVDLCIRTTLGENCSDILGKIEDKPVQAKHIDLLDCGGDALGSFLKLGEYAAKEAVNLLKKIKDITTEGIAMAMKGGGWAAKEVAEGLKAGLDLGDKAVAEAMKGAGLAAAEVAEGLKKGLDLGDKAVAEVMRGAGWAASEVAEGLKDGLDLGDKTIAEAMAAAGWAKTEVEGALNAVGVATDEAKRLVHKLSDLFPF